MASVKFIERLYRSQCQTRGRAPWLPPCANNPITPMTTLPLVWNCLLLIETNFSELWGVYLFIFKHFQIDTLVFWTGCVCLCLHSNPTVNKWGEKYVYIHSIYFILMKHFYTSVVISQPWYGWMWRHTDASPLNRTINVSPVSSLIWLCCNLFPKCDSLLLFLCNPGLQVKYLGLFFSR